MRTARAVKALLAVLSLVLAGLLLPATTAQAASLKEITDFGENPSRLRMFLYVPNTVLPAPPIVVAVHYCHGDGPAFYNGSQFGRLADQYGFIVVFPSVTQASDQCFDVASRASLTHGGGGDSLGIVSMVRYVEEHHNGDPGRVYVTGVSSGAMMTEVLLGAYPDVFQAGAAFAGVPFGCFAGSVSWSTPCADGEITRTPQEWGDLVRDAYPGYTGPRPRVQLWHGTADEVLSYTNFGEAVEQWTNVHGISQTPSSTEPGTPVADSTRTRYTDATGRTVVEAVSMRGTPHNLPVDAAAAVRFFGLDGTVVRPPTVTTGSDGQPSACAASFSVASQWNTGFTAKVRVTALEPLGGWKVTLTLPAGTSVSAPWNGRIVGTDGTVTVSNDAGNGVLAAGQSAEFGFQGSGSSDQPTLTCDAVG